MKRLSKDNARGRTMRAFRIPDLTFERLQKIAKKTERSNTDVLCLLVDNYFQEHHMITKERAADGDIRAEFTALETEFKQLQERFGRFGRRLEGNNPLTT
jgi:predicted DNA-binding protein